MKRRCVPWIRVQEHSWRSKSVHAFVYIRKSAWSWWKCILHELSSAGDGCFCIFHQSCLHGFTFRRRSVTNWLFIHLKKKSLYNWDYISKNFTLSHVQLHFGAQNIPHSRTISNAQNEAYIRWLTQLVQCSVQVHGFTSVRYYSFIPYCVRLSWWRCVIQCQTAVILLRCYISSSCFLPSGSATDRWQWINHRPNITHIPTLL